MNPNSGKNQLSAMGFTPPCKAGSRASGEGHHWGHVLEAEGGHMRKLILLCAATAMAAAAPIPAQADPPGRDSAAEILAFCQEQVDLDPNLTLGTCVSFFISSDVGFLTQFCHYLQDHDLLDGESFSQCVQDFQQSK